MLHPLPHALSSMTDPLLYSSFIAARIVRVEKVEIQTNGKSENGYLVFLEGLSTRLRIERFTMTGTPYFEAQVTPFPRQSGRSFYPFQFARRIALR